MKTEAEDVINLGSPIDLGSETQNSEKDYSENMVKKARFRTCNFKRQEGSVYIDLTDDDCGDKAKCVGVKEEDVKEVASSSFFEKSFGFAETKMAIDKESNFQHRSCPTGKDTTYANTGVKRLRKASDEQKPSVHVIYDSLTRASKRKMEELLRQWSEWQAEHESVQDPDQVLESGEETYLAAVRVGLENSSLVSYCIDNQVAKKDIKGSVLLDSSAVPYYDRGFALGLNVENDLAGTDRGLEVVDNPSRCFNCGSYSHQLNDCPKPRDTAAVKSSLEQHRLKRNHNFGPNVPTRYYRSPPGGKHYGLKPGALCAETGTLLRPDHDSSSSLNRKRELGHPSAYSYPVEEDGPSGITIYADGELKEEQRDQKKLFRNDPANYLKKKPVEYPVINTEIPTKPDKRPRASRSMNPNHLPGRPLPHSSNIQEPTSLRHFQPETRQGDISRHRGPHGLEDPFIRSAMASHPPRYGFCDDDPYRPREPHDNDPYRPRGPHDSFRRPLGPSMERYELYRDRFSPLAYKQEFSDRDRYSNLQHPSSYPLEEQNPYLGLRFGYDSYIHHRR